MKNCPFCNAPAHVTEKSRGFRVECTERFKSCNINMRTKHLATKEAAIKVWDDRIKQNNGRPIACANIYIHGRLKNKTEMKEERERIIKLSFDDLINECSPITQEKIDYIKNLVEDVDVDLDESLPETP